MLAKEFAIQNVGKRVLVSFQGCPYDAGMNLDAGATATIVGYINGESLSHNYSADNRIVVSFDDERIVKLTWSTAEYLKINRTSDNLVLLIPSAMGWKVYINSISFIIDEEPQTAYSQLCKSCGAKARRIEKKIFCSNCKCKTRKAFMKSYKSKSNTGARNKYITCTKCLKIAISGRRGNQGLYFFVCINNHSFHYEPQVGDELYGKSIYEGNYTWKTLSR